MSSETARIEAFSDGVFAIAITLLILEIKVPQPAAGPLAGQLVRQWPSYISYVISFVFIGIMWINHHRLFNHIRCSDNGLMLLNLLLLLGVTFVPYPTSVLAAQLGHTDQRLAVLLFSGTYFFIAVFFNLLWRYATSPKRHLVVPDTDAAAIEGITRQYAFGPVFYLACVGLAFVSVAASLAMNFALACFFAMPPKVATDRGR
jgi:uncharacterized membrane protein